MSHTRPVSARGSVVARTLQECGVDAITVVPDFVQIATHQYLDRQSEPFTVCYCSNENQALHVATGLYIGGRSPAVMMQNQGLYNCVNSLRACGLDAHIPLFLLIGQFGREHDNVGKSHRESRRRMVSLLEPVLDTLGVRYWHIESESDSSAITEAFNWGRAKGVPTAVIFGNHTDWE
ncbi:thiamine pyrophosphate-binding protein [Achromobacter pestifer]